MLLIGWKLRFPFVRMPTVRSRKSTVLLSGKYSQVSDLTTLRLVYYFSCFDWMFSSSIGMNIPN